VVLGQKLLEGCWKALQRDLWIGQEYSRRKGRGRRSYEDRKGNSLFFQVPDHSFACAGVSSRAVLFCDWLGDLWNFLEHYRTS
jgi:hypothetical protein